MSVSLKILSSVDVEQIIYAAQTVLAETGTVVEDDTAVNILREAGAKVEGAYRVFIPANLIERAVDRAPSTVLIYNRLGDVALDLGGHRSYFGAHVDCPDTIDFSTRERREMSLNDIEMASLVCDALPHIDFVTSLDVAADARPEYSDVAAFASTVKNTSKPIAFPFINPDTGEMIHAIASAAVGGPAQLLDKPFVIFSDSPISPLYHPQATVQRTIFAAQKGLPYLYNPMPQGGLTAPTTMAAILVVTVAELLTGLLLTQLVNPGTPFICGGVPSIFDMRDANFVYGSPELLLMCSALVDIVHSIGLPAFGTAGVTNARSFDVQAASDAALQTLMAVLSGGNLVHDVGLIDAGLAHSLAMVVLTDELVGITRRIERGIEITKETLAIDVIREVGPQGNFIAEDHTFHHFRENWYPRIFDHSRPGMDYQATKAENHIQRIIDDLLQNHEPARLPNRAIQLIGLYADKWSIESE
jgi:trimethylamine--corrinoid protein Co-methyltransferase